MYCTRNLWGTSTANLDSSVLSVQTHDFNYTHSSKFSTTEYSSIWRIKWKVGGALSNPTCAVSTEVFLQSTITAIMCCHNFGWHLLPSLLLQSLSTKHNAQCDVHNNWCSKSSVLSGGAPTPAGTLMFIMWTFFAHTYNIGIRHSWLLWVGYLWLKWLGQLFMLSFFGRYAWKTLVFRGIPFPVIA